LVLQITLVELCSLGLPQLVQRMIAVPHLQDREVLTVQVRGPGLL